MDNVYILGSGESISELTADEKERINHSACSIALNKFAAFQRIAGIWPTHVYFVDRDDDFLQYTFDLYRTPRLLPRRTAFILHRSRQHRLARSRPAYYCKMLAVTALRRSDRRVFRVPRDCHYEFVTPTNWLQRDHWATSLEQPLLHFRASLTTAINYAAICYPGACIKLVGVDLNGPNYFYQKELEQLSFWKQPWSDRITKSVGRHFTAFDHEGTNMLDMIPFIRSKLDLLHSELVCCSRNSVLVTEGHVPYSAV